MINYIVKRSNGKIFASVPNNSILGPNMPNQNPVPVNLIGRNKVGYGQAYNENALWLAENFAGQSAPRGNINGQIWYKTTSGTGELLISLKDGAAQPTSPSTELEWAAIPMITLFNTVPDGTNSNMGRMVLTSNGDRLMALMKDKEWREVQTTRPQNKQYERLLDINYDTNVKYIEFTQSSGAKPIAYFNVGGASTTQDGYTVFQNGDGVFNFGANYFFEMNIIARQVVINTTGEVVSTPAMYKNWKVQGQFYVDNEGIFTPGVTQVKDIPDPRRVANLTQIKDVISSTRDNWDVNVVINGPDVATLGPGTATTPAGYEQYVIASLNSAKHLGIRVDGTVSGLSAGQNTLTQWSVLLKITGVPPIGV